MLRFKETDPELEEVASTPTGLAIYHYQGKPYSGMVEYWSTKGFLGSEVEYRNGIPEGVQRHFYPDGKLRQESHFYYGSIDKYFKAWDEDGNLISHATYDRGSKLEDII